MDKSKPIFLESPVSIAPQTETDKQRTFSGVAYSGNAVNHNGEKIIVDLETLNIPRTSPILTSHDRKQRTGFSREITSDGELRVTGVLLKNEYGKAVADDADQGFPWQMSMGFDFGRAEFIDAGKSITINNRDFQGPGYVIRSATIREISFTPTGVDSATSARVMEHKKSIGVITMPDGDQTKIAQLSVENEQLKADNAKLALQVKETNDKLIQLHQIYRKGQVKALFEKIGMTFSDETVKPYLSMTDATFQSVSRDLTTQASRTKLPDGLFEDQATDGQADVNFEQSFSKVWGDYQKELGHG